MANDFLFSTPIKMLSISEKTRDVEHLVKKIAKWVILNKLYKQGNDLRYFTDEENKEINRVRPKDCDYIEYGYYFLDTEVSEDDRYSGMVRLVFVDKSGDTYNPKWSFWVAKGSKCVRISDA